VCPFFRLSGRRWDDTRRWSATSGFPIIIHRWCVSYIYEDIKFQRMRIGANIDGHYMWLCDFILYPCYIIMKQTCAQCTVYAFSPDVFPLVPVAVLTGFSRFYVDICVTVIFIVVRFSLNRIWIRLTFVVFTFDSVLNGAWWRYISICRLTNDRVCSNKVY